MDLSTAARITPLNGAPKLGNPGDFSAKEFKYQVTAADGTKKEWTRWKSSIATSGTR